MNIHLRNFSCYYFYLLFSRVIVSETGGFVSFSDAKLSRLFHSAIVFPKICLKTIGQTAFFRTIV